VRIVTKPFPVIENVAFSPVNFKVTEIKLYKSESTEFGSKYTLLKTFPLQKNISSTICSE
jgi:2'-5' RNA ligase